MIIAIRFNIFSKVIVDYSNDQPLIKADEANTIIQHWLGT